MFGVQPHTKAQFSRLAHLPTTCLAVALVAACASTPRAGDPTTAPVQTGDAYVDVTNLHPHNVKIVARNLHESEIPLGTVRVQASRRLTVPRTLNGAPIELIIRCTQTGDAYTTRRIVLGTGDLLDLSILDLLPLSQLVLR